MATNSLKPFYRAGDDRIGRDFFGPCLNSCSVYRRAAGFFSSSALVHWAEAIPRLLDDQTASIKLLVSPELQPADLSALRASVSLEHRQKILEEVGQCYIEKAIAFIGQTENKELRLQLFGHLIDVGRLEIRLATMEDDPLGLYHEKFGVFNFPDGGEAAFIGSANESRQAYDANGEILMVFRSWVESERDRIGMLAEQFERAWSGQQPGIIVGKPTEDVLDRLIAATRPSSFLAVREPRVAEKTTRPPPWPHQRLAIEQFLNSRRGILEMATGTGKTRTAMEIAVTLLEQQSISSFIVTTDGNDLLRQWCHELSSWRRDTNLWSRQHEHFAGTTEKESYVNSPGGAVLTVSRKNLVSVLNGLSSEAKRRLLVIHDEVHGLGAPGTIRSLAGTHGDIGYVLGLSATPEREYDLEGTEFLEREIGPVIFEYGLGDAIRDGILCPFDYVTLDYELTEFDLERLQRVWKMKSARAHQGKPMSDAEVAIEISKVYKTAESKPLVFDRYLKSVPAALEHALIFVETREYGGAVLDVVHKYTYDYKTYYADDEEEYLRRFASGKLGCLITCHRLSQGIDIPGLKTVVLFSSARAKLETIQRIGRCLRIDPSNPGKRATVVDFICRGVPDEPGSRGVNSDIAREIWLSEIASVRGKKVRGN